MSNEEANELLRQTLDVLRRLDPAWCALHNEDQTSDEELDAAIGELEEALEVAT